MALERCSIPIKTACASSRATETRSRAFLHSAEGLARDLKGRRCVLDGEVLCLNPDGKPQFRDLLFRRAEPLFYAFDILWDEHAKLDDEEENRRFRMAKAFGIYR